ncbi:Periplasmic serine protease (ClpP class) [Yersinia kristensenii ATCC 33638]|nr:Periplasmic serine protease (ClpP class) [Yersinia kristensenii ATCC 33638]
MTIVVAIGAVVLLVVSQGMRKQGQRGELNLVDLGEQYKEMQREMRLARLSHVEQKAWVKEFKKAAKI